MSAWVETEEEMWVRIRTGQPYYREGVAADCYEVSGWAKKGEVVQVLYQDINRFFAFARGGFFAFARGGRWFYVARRDVDAATPIEVLAWGGKTP